MWLRRILPVTRQLQARAQRSSSSTMFSVGNPLLDNVLFQTDEEHADWVRRFKVEAHVPQEGDTVASGMLKAVSQWRKEDGRPVSLAPGGCALNTCRVVKWLSEDPNRRTDKPALPVVFVGAVGSDHNADRLKALIEDDGVETSFYRHRDYPTGHCIGLASGVERTLVANVGAGSHFDLKNYNALNLEGNLNPLSASLIYTTGFFAVHSWDVVRKLVQLCQNSNGEQQQQSCHPRPKFAFNLGGEYVCEDKAWVRQLLSVLDGVDILFGNRSEMTGFVNTLRELEQNELAEALAYAGGLTDASPQQQQNGHADADSEQKRRMLELVVTDGPRTIVTAEVDVSRRHVVSRIVIDGVPCDGVQDTVGAGDSFAAGYLMGVLDGQRVEECVQGGIRAAHLIMRQPGTRLPKRN